MQKPCFAKPAFLLNQNAMHHGDLAGRAAEAEEGHPRPDGQRLGEARPRVAIRAKVRNLAS